MKTDLKMLDELAIAFMQTNRLTPADFEQFDSLTRSIVERLRSAYSGGEMEAITATWAFYFKG